MMIRTLSRRALAQAPAKLFRSNRSSFGFAIKACSNSNSRHLSTSPWADFEMAPVDPIVGLNEIFQKDDFPQKVIVGVCAYRDDVSLIFWVAISKPSESASSSSSHFVRLRLENHTYSRVLERQKKL